MELFGISGSEFLVLVILIVLVSGTKGVTQTMALLKKGLSSFREWNARLRQDSNLGAVAANLNISPETLDLRQYDPRRMVRDAVREEMDAWLKQTDPVDKEVVSGLTKDLAAETAAIKVAAGAAVASPLKPARSNPAPPAKADGSTATPAKADSPTATPAKADSHTATPAKADTPKAPPAKADSPKATAAKAGGPAAPSATGPPSGGLTNSSKPTDPAEAEGAQGAPDTVRITGGIS
ncbi:MAG: hypothetical protein LBE08_03370 [Bifidobacteriaceae bacterium]|jgi:sec-independent protein translocase protein TatB|nr:hypothetical protein [Bifidobacteriaceae bacterium]